MRLIFTLFLIFIHSTFFAQNVSTTQKTLITKRTASWCPNCGAWGWDFAKAIDDLSNPNGILIRAHYSGDLQSQVAQDITENFNAIYQPEFYLNEEMQSVGSTTWESKVDVFNDAINNNVSADSKVKFSGSSYKTDKGVAINAKVEFLENVSGEFYFAAYLLEDGIVNQQSGQGADAIHNAVLRSSFTEGSFGNKISEESTSVGQETAINTEIEIDGEAIEDRMFRTLLILWQKSGEQYVIENIHSYSVDISANVNDLFDEVANVNIFQNGQKLIFNLSKRFDQEINLDIFDVQGQKIYSKNSFFDRAINHQEVDITRFPKNRFVVIKLTSAAGSSFSEIIFLNFV
jgi:hypothetical protein